MRQVTVERLVRLLVPHESPCISLYQPTHRKHPDNQQDPIRFRNLVRDAEALLQERYPTRQVRPMVEKLQALGRDENFWNYRTEALAVFASPETMEIFELQRPAPELLIVADSFHVKPLIRIIQSADRYQILCLNRQQARLFEGNRDALDPVELIETPATVDEALGDQQPPQASFGVKAGGGKPVHHGIEPQTDPLDANRDRFFREVDRGILDHHSRPSGLPLLLAALPETHDPFRKISRNPFLLPTGITTNPDTLSVDDLRAQAWQIIEPHYLARLAELKDKFLAGEPRQEASADLSDAARAAVAGRVDTLLVEAERVILGTLDRTSGAIELGTEPPADDLLDDLAELVLSKNGDVVIVPAERMPTTSGLAAIYRF